MKKVWCADDQHSAMGIAKGTEVGALDFATDCEAGQYVDDGYLLGNRLGLSPFVVVVSLLFWAFVLGPIGMLLSIPLTMACKIAFEHSEEFKPVAVLLGPPRPRKDSAT